MQITVHAKGFEISQPIREYVEKRLETAADRFEHMVRGAHVTLEDVNGPKGGVDKVCRILFKGTPGAEEPIEARESDLYAAIDAAVEKANHVLAHQHKLKHPAFPDKSRQDSIRKPARGPGTGPDA